MSIKLTELPYGLEALEPHVSERTLELHHGKHHKGYVDELNAAIQGTDYEGLSLREIVLRAHANGDTSVFNNAAQAWNHDFLWRSMSPSGGGKPAGPLAEAINARFGDLAGFNREFSRSALARFGSGWTWLVQAPEGLDIVNTGNADTPITSGVEPLLTLDVWEHAYYLDHQNRRADYIEAFLVSLINWDFAAQNYAAQPVAA